ncbi:hypothetical protein GCM10025864_40760 [Luteimicrobium album]|uniref:Tetratricopeptide repeat protein n=1 Tax=Luteimicrobium album TaxID=1054550 RepID=A0ABQ6I7C0_9MICO|nr:hypothetical protein [Luteimicrobium album]GMA26317.1 hypothetical protein GCM10025864_40760 [Luteimicrobium album]
MTISQLDREVRGRLRGLTKDNAETVGRHLVMTGRLLDTDPELAYEHAQAAVRRAGRIDVVREAAGLAAYRLGNYAEALRELRTVRRLNGSSEHLPVMADAERGLGRPERALDLARSPEAETLDASGRTELALVVAGARLDLGQSEAALAVVDSIPARDVRSVELRHRVSGVRADVLDALGRTDEAAALRVVLGEPEDDIVVVDLEEDDDEVTVTDEQDVAGPADSEVASEASAEPGTVQGDGPPVEDEAPLADPESAGADKDGSADSPSSDDATSDEAPSDEGAR